MVEGEDKIYAGPEGTALRFFTEATKNGFQSEKHGRPVYDTSLMVEVMVPGSRESTPKFEVERTFCEEAGPAPGGGRMVQRSEKYDLYKVQIEAYKTNSGEYLTSGTPLGQWSGIDAGQAASLRAVGIHTVEQLSTVSDTNLANLGLGGRVLRDQAAAFLNSRAFGVPTAQMAAESANLKEANARLEQQLADAKAQIAAMTEAANGRAGSVDTSLFAVTPAPTSTADSTMFTSPATGVDTKVDLAPPALPPNTI